MKTFRKPPKINRDVIDCHTWYCLRTAPQKEFVVQHILALSGFLTYLPISEEWKFANGIAKKKRQKKYHAYPMMVGYVLIGFKPEQMHAGHTPYWASLLSQDLILSAVGIEGRPISVNRDSIHMFSERYPNGLQRPRHEAYMRTHSEFSVGDLVRVCEGPFDGLTMPVERLEKNGAQAVLKVDMFGGQQEIRIDSFVLEKAA